MHLAESPPYKILLFRGLLFFSLWTIMALMISAPGYSQSKNTRQKAGTYTARQKNKYLRQKKKSPLQKNIYHKQSKYGGTISINPRPKEYAIKGSAESNPGRKNARHVKSRRSYYRASSNRMQRSFGGLPVHQRNLAVNNKRRSNKIQKSQGNISLKPASANRNYNDIRNRTEPNPNRSRARTYRAQQAVTRGNSARSQRYQGSISSFKNKKRLNEKYMSKTVQQTSGSLKIKPGASHRDYDQIRSRTGNNPNRIEKRVQKKKESDMHGASSLAQKYQGDVKWQRESQKLNAKYRSKAIQQSSGTLKPVSPGNPTMAQKYSGQIKRQNNRQKLNVKYRSKAIQQSPGTLKPVLPGNPTIAQKYQGDIKRQKNRTKLNTQYRSKAVQQSSGNLKQSGVKKQNDYRDFNSQTASKTGGDVKVYSRSMQNRFYKRDSRTSSGGFSGNLKLASRKKRAQEEEGKSLNVSQEQGNYRTQVRRLQQNQMKRKSNLSGNFSGNLKGVTRNKRRQEEEGKSLNSSQERGWIKVYPKGAQDRITKRNSNMTGNYRGNIAGVGQRRRLQEEEGKSLNSSQHSGYIKVYTEKGRNRHLEKDSKKTGSYSGNLVLSSRKKRLQEEEGKSLNASQEEGNVRVYPQWMQNRWMKRDSKITGSYKGNLAMKSEKARGQELAGKSLNVSQYSGNARIRKPWYQQKFERDNSDKNQMARGDFKVKSKYYRDLENQIRSARVQNWEGGYKIALITRLWLRLFDTDSTKQKKKDPNIKKPKYDTREAEIWWD